MIDLTKKSLPDTVKVNGRDFAIYTDYRIWMRFVIEFEAWQKRGFRGIVDIRYLFKNEMPEFTAIKDYDGIFDFACPESIIPKKIGSDGENVLFYRYDGDYIYSAFVQQYGIDLLDVEELHWHKFKALLGGLVDTKLTEIMEYRSYTGEKVKNMDAQYRRLKDMWIPPIEMTKEEKEAEERFNNYFG